MTKTISVDFDSVLADTMVTWTNEYNRLNGTKVSKEDITHWDIGIVLPLTALEISDLFNYIWQNCWMEIPPSELGLSETIEKIHRKGYRISILTKRERSTVAYVAKWLDYHEIYSDDLVFLYDGFPKADYQFDLLIDDAPGNIVDISPPKIGVLFNQPWNKEFDWPLRVNSLSEAERNVL